MDIHAWIAIATLVVAMVLFISKLIPLEATALSIPVVLAFAHQCNLMIMGPGGYQTKDFVKVGTGLSIVMAATAIVLLAL